MADFDHKEPKPLNRFWWNLAWLITPGTPPHMTTMVGVAQRGWSGQGKYVTYHISGFLFFFSFFCFVQHAPRLHFLTDRDDLYAKRCVSGQGCALWGSRQYLTTFRGQTPKKTSPKWAGIGILQPNQRSGKIAIYRSLMKIFASDFTDRLNTGTIIEKCKIRSKGVVKGSRDLVLKFWDPLRISVMLEARNFKCGKHRPRGTLTKKMQN